MRQAIPLRLPQVGKAWSVCPLALLPMIVRGRLCRALVCVCLRKDGLQ
jgi:hypothetical protein